MPRIVALAVSKREEAPSEVTAASTPEDSSMGPHKMLIAVAATSASLGALTLDSSNKVTSTLGDSKLMDGRSAALSGSAI
mmetsp:Transcript_15379/g.42094  ORF Transcript_15379/g.42094 Transcript_15379/m.42094 type:complete len:80 (+) Transcript_15379:3598-3837(+)